MHEFPLILTLTVALTAALVLGFITHKLSLSPIVGYLLAGVAVGPGTPGFVADKHLADQMAEVGVILLMFGVGLHFHVKDLLAVRKVAIPGAIGQSFAATLLGLVLGLSFGWTWQAGVVFGLAISVASTVVLLRVLADNNDLHTTTGHISVGWLVVEDLFTVLVLVLLPVMIPAANGAAAQQNMALAIGWAIGKIFLLVATVFYVGGRVIPWFLAQVARTRSRELFTLSVLVLALGLAVAATKWFGVSAALGIVLALRYPLAVALSVAVALAQIGEFSFILATVGGQLEILPEAATNAIVAAALVSISLNPLLYRTTGWIERRVKHSPRLNAWLNKPSSISPDGELETVGASHAVVVGYGPVGRTLVRMLQENEIEPTVIELNLDTVHRLREDGIRAVYGDSTNRETMAVAGAVDAIAIFLTSAGMHGSDEAIRLVRELNPDIRVLVRAGYLKEIPALRRAGADVVFSGEGEVALTMTEFLLRHLGASEEQIDRQRERIRDELFGTPLTMELLAPLPGKGAGSQNSEARVQKSDGMDEAERK